jgi:hypothetical protein
MSEWRSFLIRQLGVWSKINIDIGLGLFKFNL